MKLVGGNTTAELQINVPTKNAIGEQVQNWQTIQTLNGWLDYQSESTQYERYGSKLEESTHVFVMNYKLIDSRATTETSRMLIDGKAYDVMLIDDPMGLKYHIEIYLQYRGGQNG